MLEMCSQIQALSTALQKACPCAEPLRGAEHELLKDTEESLEQGS